MNFGRLRFVSERAELGEGREVLFTVEIPEKPGKPFKGGSDYSLINADSLKAASCDCIISYSLER
jgi:hypothetical protein